MPHTEEQTRYIEALCQIETGIVHEGQLYLPFVDLVAMVQNMPQTTVVRSVGPVMGGILANPESWLSYWPKH